MYTTDIDFLESRIGYHQAVREQVEYIATRDLHRLDDFLAEEFPSFALDLESLEIEGEWVAFKIMHESSYSFWLERTYDDILH